MAMPIIIDCDPGIDDAMAIMLAVSAREKLEVKALTTVNGNSDIENVTKNAFKILKVCESLNIPVFQGEAHPLAGVEEACESSHGDDGMGNVDCGEVNAETEKESAVDFLIRTVKENPGVLTIMAIGPLTNIAKAIQRDSQFVKNVKRIVIMGGAESGGNMSPVAEFNFWYDPEAARIVLEAGFEDVTIIGLDVTRQVFLSPAMRELLYQIHTPVSKFIHDITRVYVDSYWKKVKNLGCELCDVLVTAYLLDETILELKDSYVEVVSDGVCAGQSVVYRCERWGDRKKNSKFAVGVDSKRFFEIFFNYQFPEYKEETQKLLDYEFR